jgi:hypothetical protein
VAGAGLLGASLSTEPDSTKFYALTLGVAGTWLIGGLRSGPLHLGWTQTRHGTLRRPVIEPIATGAAVFGSSTAPPASPGTFRSSTRQPRPSWSTRTGARDR